MSNSNHDPKNKECAIYGEEHEKEIECEHPCTCRPEQNMEEKKCMCGEHKLGYFIISERIGETIHSRESPCWVIEKEDHTKCRKLGTSDLCVCCPCGCDTPMDAPNYAELHGAPTEQKEELESPSNLQRIFSVDYVTACKIKDFIRTQLALSEERGRDAQQKEDYEIAKAHQEKAFKRGTEMGEERGRRATITAFVEWAGKQEWLNKGDLLKFADSLKSNLTQKS